MGVNWRTNQVDGVVEGEVVRDFRLGEHKMDPNSSPLIPVRVMVGLTLKEVQVVQGTAVGSCLRTHVNEFDKLMQDGWVIYGKSDDTVAMRPIGFHDVIVQPMSLSIQHSIRGAREFGTDELMPALATIQGQLFLIQDRLGAIAQLRAD